MSDITLDSGFGYTLDYPKESDIGILWSLKKRRGRSLYRYGIFTELSLPQSPTIANPHIGRPRKRLLT